MACDDFRYEWSTDPNACGHPAIALDDSRERREWAAVLGAEAGVELLWIEFGPRPCKLCLYARRDTLRDRPQRGWEIGTPANTDGVLKPDSGRVIAAGEDITEYSEERLECIHKKVTMVFQNGALFNSHTVGDNVAYALRERGERRRSAN